MTLTAEQAGNDSAALIRLYQSDGTTRATVTVSDTAAAISLGFAAVGRPSCSGALEQTRAFCFRHGVQKVIVMADQDAPHRRPNGTVWYPGWDGAERLVAALELPFKVVMPPAKDLRAWVIEGATVLLGAVLVSWILLVEGAVVVRYVSLPLATTAI